MLHVGASRIVITPPLETPIGAFGEWNQRFFCGITRDIYARALVIRRDEDTPSALISVEATEISEQVTLSIQKEVERRSGIPSSNTLVAMTHNHSGPGLLRMANAYVEVVSQKIADAVVLACQQLRPAQLGWSVRQIDGPATNRRIQLKNGSVWPRFFLGPTIPTRENAEQIFSKLSYAPNVDYRSVPEASEIVGSGPVNPQLFVANLVDCCDGSTIATLAHYGCHASAALESRNIHGDFPGFACSRVEEAAGGVCLFFAGPSANINCNGFLRERTDAEAERLGLEFAHQILAARETASPTKDDLLVATSSASTYLPLRDEMKPEFNQQALALAASGLEGTEGRLREAERVSQEIQILQNLESEGVLPPVTKDQNIQVEISAVRVGSLVFVSIPGEMFVETGVRLSRISPWQPTLIITHCNGSVGYIPEPSAFGQGGYEDAPSYCCFVGPESEDAILSACKSLLNTI